MSIIQLQYGGRAAPVTFFPLGFSAGIQKEFVRAEDGTVLSERHNISIKGNVIISTGVIIGGDGSPYVPEDRYAKLLEQSFELANWNLPTSGRLGAIQKYPLTITRYNSYADVPNNAQRDLFKYPLASLNSINVSPPNDDTAGLNYFEATMEFTAEFMDRPDDIGIFKPKYHLKSASETFAVQKQEDKVTCFNMLFDTAGNVTGVNYDPFYTYTITHSVNAQGVSFSQFYSDPTGTVPSIPVAQTGNYEAFYEAYKFVSDRIRDSLSNVQLNVDIYGNTMIGNNYFIPGAWHIDNTGTIPGQTPIDGQFLGFNTQPENSNDSLLPLQASTLESGGARVIDSTNYITRSGSIISDLLGLSGIENPYKEYNRVRTSNVDMLQGSYSVETTYTYSRSPATLDLNITYEKDEGGNDTIRLDGNIQGLDSGNVTSSKIFKNNAAKEYFHLLCYSGINSSWDKYPNPTGYERYDINSGVLSDTTSGISVAGNTRPEINYLPGSAIVQSIGTNYTEKIITPWGINTPIYKAVEDFYNENVYNPYVNANLLLDVRPLTTSVAVSKNNGTINFNASYKPIPATLRQFKAKIPNLLSVTLSQNDSNTPINTNATLLKAISPYATSSANPVFASQTIGVVPVMGRSIGPVLQDMSTTKESTRQVQIQAIFDIAERYPDAVNVANSGPRKCIEESALLYYPRGTNNYYLNDYSYTWDWAVGTLNLTLQWIYTR